MGWHSWVISAFWRECNWTHAEIVVNWFKMAWHGVTFFLRSVFANPCSTQRPRQHFIKFTLCTDLYFICYRLYVDMLYVDNMCIFFDILRLDTCECQSHYRAVNCGIVRSSWSQMKRPRWSLITGAAWCWLMFWSQPLHHQDARCLPAKVGVYNKFLITHTVWELTSTSSWGRRNHKSCNIIATLGG